jgi:hypothetical protein
MSTNLQGAELNYPTINKQAYVVYKEVKHFRSYILKNHTKVIVPHASMRSLFTQQELGEWRGNWMIIIQEFDLEIKPTKIVRGQGLCKLATKSQDLEGSMSLDGKMNCLYVVMKYFMYQQIMTHGIESLLFYTSWYVPRSLES